MAESLIHTHLHNTPVLDSTSTSDSDADDKETIADFSSEAVGKVESEGEILCSPMHSADQMDPRADNVNEDDGVEVVLDTNESVAPYTMTWSSLRGHSHQSVRVIPTITTKEPFHDTGSEVSDAELVESLCDLGLEFDYILEPEESNNDANDQPGLEENFGVEDWDLSRQSMQATASTALTQVHS